MSDRSAGIGIEYDVPAGFVEGDVDGLIVVGDPGNELGFFIKRSATAETDQAIADLEAQLSQLFQDVRTSGEPKKGMLNDIPATDVEATGTFQGRPCLISICWLQLSADALVVVMGAVLKEKKDQWQQTADKFIKSIRRAA